MFRGCGSNLNLFVVLCFFFLLLLVYREPFGDAQPASIALAVVWGRWFSVVWVEVYLCSLQE